MTTATQEPIVYQGQFGEFTITEGDRQGVLVYRAGLMTAALCFALGTGFALWGGHLASVPTLLTFLFAGFAIALGVSLWTIHIYLKPLHQALQILWAIGVIASGAIAIASPDPLAIAVYQQPLTLLGIGCLFAALTGIFFKEAFCFNRLETKLLTPLVPALLLGHLIKALPLSVERGLLLAWAALFLVFVIRKAVQPIPADIGDKSVFEHLHQQAQPSQRPTP